MRRLRRGRRTWGRAGDRRRLWRRLERRLSRRHKGRERARHVRRLGRGQRRGHWRRPGCRLGCRLGRGLGSREWARYVRRLWGRGKRGPRAGLHRGLPRAREAELELPLLRRRGALHHHPERAWVHNVVLENGAEEARRLVGHQRRGWLHGAAIVEAEVGADGRLGEAGRGRHRHGARGH